MNILLTVPYFFPYSFGGGQIYVLRLSRELHRRGHKVSIITTAPWDHPSGDIHYDHWQNEEISVTAIGINPAAESESDRWSECGYWLKRALRPVILEAKPDLAHLNGIKPLMTRLCNEIGIPFVITAHHPGFCCPVGSLLTPEESICQNATERNYCILCCCRHKTGGRWFGEFLGRMPAFFSQSIGNYFSPILQKTRLGRGLLFPWLVEQRIKKLHILLHETRLIIAPSQAMGRLLQRNGVPERRIRVVPHGIEPLTSTPTQALAGRPIRFGFVGRIDRAKGLHVLLKAMELIPRPERAELHIFGEAQAPWDQSYQRESILCYQGKVPVIEHGLIPSDRLQEIYAAIDVLVVPSIYFEVFGLVILEAFSAGRPVIASTSGGPEELVQDGENGLIVPANDPPALSRAIQRLINEPALIETMASHIKPVRNMVQHVEQLLSVYQEVLG